MPGEILCDGCGRPATAEHIRERLARLEWATRFRPIHIQVLLLISAPPAGADFYDASTENSNLAALEGLFDAFEIITAGREAALGELQRRGVFLATVSECPLGAAEIPGAIERLGPAIAKRVRFSYKPKAIVLLSPELASLNGPLAAAGQVIRILHASDSLARAARGDADAGAELRGIFAAALQC